MLTIQMIDEFGDNFRISFRFEGMSFDLEIVFHIFVIGDDAIVHHNEWMLCIGTLWMGVYFTWYTVCSPSSVCNTNMCI